ncbi:nucleotidyltransferase family protein, partial [Staphylococcus aureus]
SSDLKRYTHTHIQRVLMNVLLHFTYNDVNTDVKAVRILGMNVKGQAYLKQVKQRHPDKKFITNVNKATADYFKNEIKATHIYNLLT